MPAATLMVQGTASHAGKSVLTAGLARLFQREGRRVAPFKAQNLSLNAAVAAGVLPGEPPGEIGFAQWVQAAACRVPATVDMNPVLLKPTPGGCECIVRGRVVGSSPADGAAPSPDLLAAVRQSLDRLRAAHDLVLLEGAGSPAEINLHARDVANRWAAEAADAPILLVGDIERGGVFASLLGTWQLSPHPERIRGFVVNKLHGGAADLAPGLRELERRTGVPTLGVVPWHHPRLPEEDAVALACTAPSPPPGALRIGVVRLPHISNFTDFAELEGVVYCEHPAALAAADVIVLPGSKATVADLAALRARGLDRIILEAAAAGKPIFGICGGYQMLGSEIRDPDGIESAHPSVAGLGLLPVSTEFEPAKRTELVSFWDGAASRSAYRIQYGRTRRHGGSPLFALTDGDEDGCAVANVAGTGLHGALTPSLLQSWCQMAGKCSVTDSPPSFSLDSRLDAWATFLAQHIDWPKVRALARPKI